MNNTIKRRRGYFPDEEEPTAYEREIHVWIPSPTPRLDSQPAQDYICRQAPTTTVNISIPLNKLLRYSHETHKEILEIAADNLNLPAAFLHDLSATAASHQLLGQQPSHHVSQPTDFNTHKRLRLELPTGAPMPAPYTDSPGGQGALEEKPRLTGLPPPRQAENSPRGTYGEPSIPSGWTTERVAGCLAGFGNICPPYTPATYESQPAYHPIPTTEPYCYRDSRSALDEGVVSLQPQSHLPPNPGALASGQPELYPCDNPGMGPPYVAGYPPLQPTQSPGMQPPTTREEMIYPPVPPINRYSGNDASMAGVTGLGIQGQISPIVPAVGPNAMSSAYHQEGGSPAFGPFGGFTPLHATFSPTPGYLVKHEPDLLIPYGHFPHQHQKHVPAKRGPFRDNEQRLATARTRKKGSCIRCRMQRIRCVEDDADQEGPCVPCKKINSNNRIYRLSCLRWKITDVKLFKPGQVRGLEWTLRWKGSVVDDIGNWASGDIRVINVTEGYTGKSVQLQVREFQPQPGDRLERSWYANGQKVAKRIPAFAIVDMDSAKKMFDDYIKNNIQGCCKTLLGHPQREILWQTYDRALRAVEDPSTSKADRQLLQSTLDLWMSVRLTTKSFEIVGDDILGMNRADFDDEGNPLRGKIPLPPVMGAQIDSILIHQIQPHLRRITLEELQKMTQEKKQRTWLTTYLVSFILLHNIALVTKHDADYATKHGMNRRFAREASVKEYNAGANTLLAYFHYCNKGIYPFSPECRDTDLQSLAELNSDAIEFVRYTRAHAAREQTAWEKLWKDDIYEDEYYYLSQLFEQNWQPRIM